jgi:hypothetical protein
MYPKRGFFSISYDGQSILIDKVADRNGHNFWIPEFLFGYLRIPAFCYGFETMRNNVMRACGLDAKFLNVIMSTISSSKFIIDIVSYVNGNLLSYHQEFRDNMRTCYPADIRPTQNSNISSTTITFYPEPSVLSFDDDTISAMFECTRNLAHASTDYEVYLFDDEVPINPPVPDYMPYVDDDD